LLGGVDAAGKVLLKVELESLRTGVLLQDQRLYQELFDTSRYEFAEVRGQLDMLPITNLAPGAQMQMQMPVTLTLHGMHKALNLDLLVTRLDQHRFQVVTFTPVVLDAADYGLTTALDSLRKSVGLNSVSLVVPVTAVLIFSEH
jgi:polyisoprenoid-binding protein YceI